MSVLFSDDFNRADQAGLGADWTLDGQMTSAELRIVSNEAKGEDNFGLPVTGSAWVNAIAARADMTVQARIKSESPGDTRAILVGRRTAVNTFYYAQISTSAGQITIQRVVAGTNASLAVTSLVDGANFHKYRFEVFGTSLKVFRENVEVLSTTDGNITAAGRGGIRLTSNAAGKFAFADDFFIADVAGDIDPLHVDSDHVIPIHFKYILNSDLVIPVQFRYVLNADSRVPIEWDIDGLIRSDHAIPLQYKHRLNSDLIIPITIALPGGIIADFIIPIQFRRQVESDQIIPILWKLFTDWVKQADSQAPAWAQQAASQADAWTKQGASQPSTWTPE